MRHRVPQRSPGSPHRRPLATFLTLLWGVLLLVAGVGTVTAAADDPTGPGTGAPASAATPHGAPARPAPVRPARGHPAAAEAPGAGAVHGHGHTVQAAHTALVPASHEARLAGHPPLPTALPVRAVPDDEPPLPSALVAGPRQERAPPQNDDSPRSARGPPALRSS
ncbi:MULTISPECIES: hypothetical protein [Streptomyces]|uniref:hypothetical protein n=1 Tax=Streptomyces TaxID=1883 RepID=UPI0004BDA6FD|nr:MULTISPECIES: hypothetical protein [Streptomyces]QHF97771.1 hypothetical protein DEH18_32345 [Streptomyces sp. NHF165]